jgi:UDP-N-acetylglucosamine--N-acetylmuramyl-(pentapeptide) pyrophosphoryl-undecaprenol N-acetylglucosamine transferase
MKIVLTGGGTGGHAYPAVSIAAELRSSYPNCELLYLGSRGGFEARLAAEADIPYFGLTSRKLRKAVSVGAVLAVGSLGKGLMEALEALNRFKPDLVIGTGGYAAAAVVLAQGLRRGRSLIHEQNAVPGRTNLWLSRFATRICVTFPDSAAYFPARKTVVTGLPIRAGLLDLPDKAEARSSLGLSPELFTVLVLGGSQGAVRLNQAVGDAIPELRQMPVQVLHQSGERNFEEADRLRESAGWDRYRVRAFFDDMRYAYASADLVVCRSGASTLAEIAAAGLPSILVPYPHAHADHQLHNAEYVVRGGGALLVRDSDLDANGLVDHIGRLISSPDELRKMSDASRRLGRPHAARDIVAVAAEIIEEKGR